MRRTDRLAFLALLLVAAPAAAQDAAVAPVDPRPAPGPVDPAQALPLGHPAVGGDPRLDGGGDPAVRRAALPQTFAEESATVPEGTVVVRVIDVRGAAVEGAPVRLGSMREGERDAPREARTNADGVATFGGLARSGNVAYRVSTEVDGAKFGALPFQLGSTAGHRVQIVRYDVDHEGRGVLLWDARTEMRFRDDRLLVVQRLRLANLSALALGEEQPNPRAYVPRDGLRFALPAGYTAFTTQPSMNDVRVTTEGDDAVVRGSLPPTLSEPVEVVFQFQVKLSGGDVALRLGMALPVVNALVAVEAPAGLTLSVDGMPAAEARESNGEKILLTGVSRQPSDAPLRAVAIHLSGIPSPAGPARPIATGAMALLVVGGLYTALRRGNTTSGKRSRADIEAERDRVLAEGAELTRRHEAGDVGPLSYARRRRELTLWLSTLLKELDEVSA
jgi:hypothetical protein